jgi:hypothetical protein
VRGHGDGDRGHHDEHCGQQRDRPHVRAQLAQIGEEAARVQQRREEDHEHESGVEAHVWNAGQEAEHRAAEDQQDGVRDTGPRRHPAEDRHGQEEADDHGFEVVHPPGIILKRPGPVWKTSGL